MRVAADAPGKLVLLGEYAVLEGAPGLVAAVDRRARVLLETDLRPEIRAPSIGIDSARLALGPSGVEWASEVTEADRARLRLVAACIEATGQPFAASLSIDTSELATGAGKLGVGSSAAVVAATSGALLTAGGVQADESFSQRVFDVAWQAHHRGQGGRGSGIDVAAAVFGGLVRYERRQAEPVHMPLARPAWLAPLCVWSGRPASTAERLAQVQTFAERHRRAYCGLMDELERVSEIGCDAVAGDDPARFFAAVESYAAGLERLGRASGAEIWSPEHRRVAEVVRSVGGVYKPSGAGGGDLGIAFAGSGAVRRRVANAVSQAGFEIVELEIAAPGVSVSLIKKGMPEVRWR